MARLVLLEPAGNDPSVSAGRSTLVHVVATRPDVVSLAPVFSALERRGAFRQLILHTGQHSDAVLTAEIFEDLGLRPPDRRLRTGAGTHAEQTARGLEGSEAVLAELSPATVLVTGASNSALGCALAAAKLGLPIARLEAGLREHDRRVPEELNRVLMDTLADTLLAPTHDAAAALVAGGAGPGSVHVVGSTAVDALRRCERRAVERAVWDRLGLDRGGYVLVTLHRPANVDEDVRLARIVEALAGLAVHVPVVFPLHPRTRARLKPMGDVHRLLAAGVLCVPPFGYLDFLSLQAGAGAIVTDSGTVQDEASALGVRCYTLRTSTERTITLTHGTNTLLGDDPRDIADVRPAPGDPTPCAIPLWDGRAGERTADALVANYALVRAAGAS